MSDWKVKKLLNLTYNGPAYRGAPYPPFNPMKLNVEKIPDNMRPKSFDLDLEFGTGDSFNTIPQFTLTYITQEPFTYEDSQIFFEEIARCIKYRMQHLNIINQDFILYVEVQCRDGKEYGYQEKTFTYARDEVIGEAYNDNRYVIQDVPKEAITYEGEEEPDLSWLVRNYSVNFYYNGDTEHSYHVEGDCENLKRFYNDHNLDIYNIKKPWEYQDEIIGID